MSQNLQRANAQTPVVINISGEDRNRAKISFNRTLSVAELGINLSSTNTSAIPPRPSFPNAALQAIAGDSSLTPAERNSQSNTLLSAFQQDMTNWESTYGSTPLEERFRQSIRDFLSRNNVNYDPNKLVISGTEVGGQLILSVTGTASSGN